MRCLNIYVRLINIVLLYCTSIYSQSVTVTGYAVDSQTGNALPGTNIIVKDTQSGTTSDERGAFVVKVPRGKELLFRYIGYHSETVPIISTKDTLKVTVKMTATSYLLNEITVYSHSSEKKLTGKFDIYSRQINKLSGSLQDVMRAMQVLPGVNFKSALESRFYVRGGDTNENLVLIDNTEVYSPYHLKEARNASIGIFNVDLIKRVVLSSGGFSARYGDKMSALLDIQYREGNKEKFQGKGMISATDLNLLFEGPISKKSTFILGVRKSYLGYLINYLNLNRFIHPSYYDIQGQVVYYPSPDDRLSVLYVQSGDDFTYDPENKQLSESGNWQIKIGEDTLTANKNVDSFKKIDSNYGTDFVALSWRHVFSGKGMLLARSSYYYDLENENRKENFESNYDLADNYFMKTKNFTTLLNKTKLNVAEGSLDGVFQPVQPLELEFGGRYRRILYNINRQEEDYYETTSNYFNYPQIAVIDRDTLLAEANQTIIEDMRTFKASSYLQGKWQLNQRITAGIGGRIDYFGINKDLNVSPRLQIAYRLSDKSVLRGAWGTYYQSPTFKELKSFTKNEYNPRAQVADHYVVGIEKKFNPQISFKMEGYYKKLKHLISAYSYRGRLIYSHKNDATGYSSGVDGQFVVNTNKFFGWVSYGFLQARENQIGDEIGSYPRLTDQQHTLSSIGEWKLPKLWTFNFRLFWGSGFPFTPYSTVLDDRGRQQWQAEKKHSDRLPPYLRVDIRVDKIFEFPRFSIAAFLDIVNLLNRKNIAHYNYRFDSDRKPEEEKVYLSPFVPTFGITMSF